MNNHTRQLARILAQLFFKKNNLRIENYPVTQKPQETEDTIYLKTKASAQAATPLFDRTFTSW